MGAKSSIEWLEGGASWNFLYGCTKVSPGCRECYAERVVPRIGEMAIGEEVTPTGDGRRDVKASYAGTVIFRGDKLTEPARWAKGRKIFPNSLSDLFHENVPERLIDRAFDVMQLAPQHTFIILTKRAQRLAEYLTRRVGHVGKDGLRNIWAGASAENNDLLHERAPWVQRLPTPVRLLSLEPLLSSVAVEPFVGWQPDKVNWVIVGGESGRRARPMQEEWAERVVRACRKAKVPVFVKQMGAAWATEQQKLGNPFRKTPGATKGAIPGMWPKELQVREVPRG